MVKVATNTAGWLPSSCLSDSGALCQRLTKVTLRFCFLGLASIAQYQQLSLLVSGTCLHRLAMACCVLPWSTACLQQTSAP